MTNANRTVFDLDRIGGRKALSEVIDQVLAAGEEALQHYRKGNANHYENKPDHSPVTIADRAIEQRLRGFLLARFPQIGFLGEESGEVGMGERKMRFIVDPIDGTRAFIRGLQTWSVIVGLEADGEPVLAVVFMPAAGNLYVAVKGEGAFGNGKPLRVSAIDSLQLALVSHGGLNQFTSTGFERVLPALAGASYSQRGFADFDGHRTVLHGNADAMLDPGVKPWDLCATAVLVREAGGTMTSFEGEHTIYGGSALISNGLIHQQLLDIISRSKEPESIGQTG
ncbi:MAG: inositol monophosphatase [Deltaproteobacteria bacterium]|nr:inositol monophosphatase [Deltaproteobacteria bacterium]